MHIVSTARMRFCALAVVLFSISIILYGCGKRDEQSGSGSPGSVSATVAPALTATPERTLEAFVAALEANDPILAASFFADSERTMYEPILKKLDLAALAIDLRKYPPASIAVTEDYAEFMMTSTATGKPVREEITLIFDGGQWRLVSI